MKEKRVDEFFSTVAFPFTKNRVDFKDELILDQRKYNYLCKDILG